MNKEELEKIYSQTLDEEFECLSKIRSKHNVFKQFQKQDIRGINQYTKITEEFFNKCDKVLQKIDQQNKRKEADDLVAANTPLSDDGYKAEKQIENLRFAIKIYDEFGDSEKKEKVLNIINEYNNREKLLEAEQLVKDNLPILNDNNYQQIGKAYLIYKKIGINEEIEKLDAAIKKYGTKKAREKAKIDRIYYRHERIAKFKSFLGPCLRVLGLFIAPIGLSAFAGWVIFGHKQQLVLELDMFLYVLIIIAWVFVTIGILVLSGFNIVNIPNYDKDDDWRKNKGSLWTGIITFGLLCGSMYPFLIYKSVTVLESHYNIANHFEVTLNNITKKEDSTNVEFEYTIKNNVRNSLYLWFYIVSYVNENIVEETSRTHTFYEEETFTYSLYDKDAYNANQNEIGLVIFIRYASPEHISPYSRLVIKSNDFIEHSEDKYNEAIAFYESGNYYDAYTIFDNLFSYKDNSEYQQKCRDELKILAQEKCEENNFLEAYKIYQTLNLWTKNNYSKESSEILSKAIEQGDNFAKQGKLDEAKKLLQDLKELGAYFSDPDHFSEYVDYTYALQLLEDHKYDEAKEVFKNIGDYKESVNYYLYESDYQKGIYLYDQGKYSEAEQIFNKIDSINMYYKDNLKYLQSCRAQPGIKLFNEGRYREAYEIFSINYLSDISREYRIKIGDIAKDNAYQLVSEGKLQEAFDYLNTFGETFTTSLGIYNSLKKALDEKIYTDLVNSFGLTTLIVPEGVEVLPYRSIQQVTLDEVILPSTLKELGHDVFLYSKITKPIHIPEGVTKLGDHIFTFMEDIKEVYIPASVDEFGIEFFRDTNKSLQKIYYSGTKDTFLSKTSLDAKWLDGYNQTGSVLKIICTDYTYYYLTNEWTPN